eukprot:TRINITY_DN21047_c0_g2_i1.p1 TRINITY_DN21047_c0_g2~~TRINITY_DN21047_c0_g2_i1.p1  ORF type:complete len:994 (-),score=191.48 TRINITY_DN21047_c0_g2_i1:104-3085(-)
MELTAPLSLAGTQQVRPPASRPSARHLALARVRQRRMGSQDQESSESPESSHASLLDVSHEDRGRKTEDGLPHSLWQDELRPPSQRAAARPRSAADGQQRSCFDESSNLRPIRPPLPPSGTSVVAAVRRLREEEESRQQRLAAVQQSALKREEHSPSPISNHDEDVCKGAREVDEAVSSCTSEAEAVAEILHRRLHQRHAARLTSRSASPNSPIPTFPTVVDTAMTDLPGEDCRSANASRGLSAASVSAQEFPVEAHSSEGGEMNVQAVLGELEESFGGVCTHLNASGVGDELHDLSSECFMPEADSDRIVLPVQDCWHRQPLQGGSSEAEDKHQLYKSACEADSEEEQRREAWERAREQEKEDWGWRWDARDVSEPATASQEDEGQAEGMHWPWVRFEGEESQSGDDQEAQASAPRPTTRRDQRGARPRHDAGMLGRWSDEPCDADEALDTEWADFFDLESLEGEDDELLTLFRQGVGSQDSWPESDGAGLEIQISFAPRDLFIIYEDDEEDEEDEDREDLAATQSLEADQEMQEVIQEGLADDESLVLGSPQVSFNMSDEAVTEDGMLCDCEDIPVFHKEGDWIGGKAVESDDTAETECMSSVAPTECELKSLLPDDDDDMEEDGIGDFVPTAPEEIEKDLSSHCIDRVGSARCATSLIALDAETRATAASADEKVWACVAPLCLDEESHPQDEDAKCSQKVGTPPLEEPQHVAWTLQPIESDKVDPRECEAQDDPDSTASQWSVQWSAAALVQAVYRRRLARLQFARKQSASKTVSTVELAARGLASLRAKAKHHEAQSAIQIQAAWRGTLARRWALACRTETFGAFKDKSAGSSISASLERDHGSTSKEKSRPLQPRPKELKRQGQRPRSSKVPSVTVTEQRTERPPSAPRGSSKGSKRRQSVSELLDQMQDMPRATAAPGGLPRLGSASGSSRNSNEQRFPPSASFKRAESPQRVAESAHRQVAAPSASTRRQRTMLSTLPSPRRSWG